MALLTIGASAGAARAETASSMFEHRQGVVVSATVSQGTNNDDNATDFTGSFPFTGFELGYQFRTGTEAFVAAGTGLGGHESILLHYGIGVRQRVRLGAVEPYVEGGRFWVGDDEGTPMAWGAGGGVDLRFRSGVSAGAGFGHYFSKDTDADGALDWYARANITWLIGR